VPCPWSTQSRAAFSNCEHVKMVAESTLERNRTTLRPQDFGAAAVVHLRFASQTATARLPTVKLRDIPWVP